MKKISHILKIKKIFLWAVLLLLPLSCVKGLEEGEHSKATQSNKILFSGIDINSVTKTSLNGSQVSWIANSDKIGLFSPNARQTVEGTAGAWNVELTAAESAVKSNFTGEIYWGEGNHSFTAYYPYKTPVTQPNPLEEEVPVIVSLPTTQIQAGATNAHIGTYDFMIATPLLGISPGITGESATVDLSFNHIFALLEFKIVSEDTKTITEVEIIAPDGKILSFGEATVNIAQTPPANKDPYIITNLASSSQSVKINITGGVNTTNSSATTPSVYLMMAPIDLTSTNVTIKITTSDNTIYQTIKLGKLFKRGVKYTVLSEIADGSGAGKVTWIDEQ